MAQLSRMTSRSSERRSSSSDWVESTIAALCLRQVLSASTTYRRMLGFFKNTQASSMKKALKTVRNLLVADHRVGAMQDIKEQRLQKFRVLAHLLEVEALETRETRWCLPALSKRNPNWPPRVHLRETARTTRAASVFAEHTQGAQRRVDGVQIFDLLIQFAFVPQDPVQLARSLAEDLDEQGQEIEVLLRGRKRERVDREILRTRSRR